MLSSAVLVRTYFGVVFYFRVALVLGRDGLSFSLAFALVFGRGRTKEVLLAHSRKLRRVERLPNLTLAVFVVSSACLLIVIDDTLHSGLDSCEEIKLDLTMLTY